MLYLNSASKHNQTFYISMLETQVTTAQLKTHLSQLISKDY
jgi:hypothetical protein